MIRLTWVQPEDLVGHELRQAAEDGRDVREIAARWRAAGGHDAPPRAGASEPGALRLRPLAERLLDELAAIQSPLDEPTDLDAIIAATPAWPARRTGTPPGAVPAVDPARLLGAWEGRAAGCVLGKPVEKIPREGVREIAQATGNWPIRGWFTARGLPAEVAARWPWNRRSAVNSLAENIDGVPEDDDLNYPLLALTVLERHGRGFTTDDVAKLWLDELPAGRTFTAERVAYRNLLSGVEPPETATHRNPFREWIGALIRTDVYGWVNPGDPATAAEYAWRDARLTHTANGVYGAMFAAALCAQSLVATSVEEVVAAGLSVVPPASRLHDAVRRAAEDAASEPDFERVLDRLHERHAGLHWVHTINNAALVAAALVHGRGDFTASIAGAVAGGWDTDSAGATVGSVAGALNGGVPARWKMRNSLASSLTGFDGIGLDELARRTGELMQA
ncbi:ADP-ribosylglycohydrolase family protein [Nonomuraea roseoviolacea subsp. roseoviolacea]|uniref:ADP-ribosylglycohydrolase n=1 Tax=Nonomuraea roseoviolacea subsp. carminata TaxID=160689 RepID=A0ABT1K931_9ACTN|nr:ADP-ribosylglycohydrolase family protein [Nonomuraea roseoviolacea]MCP2350522.1 ADP-ribosylglycohydrolase [Nonomuraea roseoviolacea subsp. carminata]